MTHGFTKNVPTDNDVTLGSDSQVTVPTQHAVKSYVDTRAQPVDSDLTTIAGLSPSNDDVIQRKAGAWINRTIAQLVTDIRTILDTIYIAVTGWIPENSTWTFYNRTEAFTNDPAAGVDVVLSVANTTDFVAGSHVTVSSGAGSEDTFIKSVVANTSVTVNQLQIDHNTTNRLITLLDTLTINADVTGTIKKYFRIKLTQTTEKFWVVKSTPVYSGGVTTLTFIHTTDYTLTNAAISSTYYSPMDNPAGWPDWFAYDGAPLGFLSEPTIQTYKWRAIGHTMFNSYASGGSDTSNATTFTSAASVTPAFSVSCLNTTATDNSVLLAVPSRTVILTTNVQTLVHRTDLSTGAWTAANVKAVSGIMIYEW